MNKLLDQTTFRSSHLIRNPPRISNFMEMANSFFHQLAGKIVGLNERKVVFSPHGAQKLIKRFDFRKGSLITIQKNKLAPKREGCIDLTVCIIANSKGFSICGWLQVHAWFLACQNVAHPSLDNFVSIWDRNITIPDERCLPSLAIPKSRRKFHNIEQKISQTPIGAGLQHYHPVSPANLIGVEALLFLVFFLEAQYGSWRRNSNNAIYSAAQ